MSCIAGFDSKLPMTNSGRMVSFHGALIYLKKSYAYSPNLCFSKIKYYYCFLTHDRSEEQEKGLFSEIAVLIFYFRLYYISIYTGDLTGSHLLCLKILDFLNFGGHSMLY